MSEKYPLIRCSVRFQNVIREISQQLHISGPVVTDLILDGYYKGGLVLPGQPSRIYKIISVHEREAYNSTPLKTMPKKTKNEQT
jgi:hypothetical protein